MFLEDRLRLKVKVKPKISLCVAIMLDHIYTVLPYCVILRKIYIHRGRYINTMGYYTEHRQRYANTAKYVCQKRLWFVPKIALNNVLIKDMQIPREIYYIYAAGDIVYISEHICILQEIYVGDIIYM